MSVVLTVTEESQQAMIAFHRRSGCVLQNLRTLVSCGSHGGDVFPAVIDTDRLQIGIGQIDIPFDKVCALTGVPLFRVTRVSIASANHHVQPRQQPHVHVEESRPHGPACPHFQSA